VEPSADSCRPGERVFTEGRNQKPVSLPLFLKALWGFQRGCHRARLRSAGRCAQFTRTVVSEYGARVTTNDELDTPVALCPIDELFSP